MVCCHPKALAPPRRQILWKEGWAGASVHDPSMVKTLAPALLLQRWIRYQAELSARITPLVMQSHPHCPSPLPFLSSSITPPPVSVTPNCEVQPPGAEGRP